MTQASKSSDLAIAPEAERRASSRRRTLFSGKIIFKQHSSVFNCIVWNLSETGACLEIESLVGIPDQFELLVEGADIRADYRVIWRRGKRIGVSLVRGS